MKRVLFIYNRHAGKSKTWTNLSDILNAMTEQGCLVTAYPTQYPGDAGEAVVRWSADYDQVVVAGGDGTLSEAIAGASRLPVQPVIGYVPVGSTNDFSKNLDLPSDKLTQLAVTAVTGVPHIHDMGRFNGKSFLYVAAFGAFTEISYSTSQKAKNLLGYNAYMLEVVKNLPSIKPHHIKVEYEDQVIEGDFLYGMVSNTTSVGRFQNFPPGHPDLSDGLLEVTLISPVRDAKDIEEFSRALLKTDPSSLSSMLTTFSTPKVTITAADELLWTLDGEAGGAHTVAEIEVVPGAYTILHGK
ncbi:MAG: diacylglycerol kinase family lipid kinase [Clostridiales bacterium]|nr:diacylglycerol kinase family lipid kinase [Clostridiales bacterium]